MASQISHIPYALQIKEKFLSDITINEPCFIIGNLFPDIRYVAGLSREETHAAGKDFALLKGIKDDFEKGRQAHAMVDLKRQKNTSGDTCLRDTQRELLY